MCFVLTAMVLLGTCVVGISAASVSSGSLISEYTCDFEGNYYSNLKSDNCTSGRIYEADGSNVLDFTVNSNSLTERFEIYNSSNGVISLKDGNVYAVSVTYKVVRIGGENASAATQIDIVRYTGAGNQLVKVDTLPDAVYYPGDTTDWITRTLVFKAGTASSPEYSRLAVNVISNSCPDVATNIESNTTSILFDNIVVTECNGSTNSIRFVSNGGSYCEPVLAQAGEEIALPTPTRDLYDFDGWYTNVDLTKKYNKSTMPSDLVTRLYAKWNISESAVKINFVTNNGTTLPDMVGREGDAITLPKLTGQRIHFAGWYDKSLKTRYDLTTYPSESMTLYAKWEVIPLLCGFDNTNDFPKPNNSTFTMRCILTDDDKYRGSHSLHYSFQRGFELSGSTGKSTPAGVMLVDEEGNQVSLRRGVTYNVSFKYKVKSYISAKAHITLIASGKGGAWEGRKLQDCILNYDASDVGKGWQSHTFTVEWDATSDSASFISIGIAGESEIYVDEILIYEKNSNYVCNPNDMMLCFDTGVAPIIDTVFAERGTVCTLPTPEMEGYRFLGWCYDPECLNAVGSDTITLDKVYTVLYADWYKIPPVTEQPEPEPEPEPEVEPKPEPEPEKNDNTTLIIIIAVAAAVVVAAVVAVVVIVKKGKKKKSAPQNQEIDNESIKDTPTDDADSEDDGKEEK